jgi:hypothetical protein
VARRVANVTWPAGRAPDVPYLGAGERAAIVPAGTYPVPRGRGRWRLTLHRRSYSANVPYAQTVITEIMGARSRQLTREWNQPDTFGFVVEGTSDAAALCDELTTEVVAWRWDDTAGADVAMFRGPICQSQDTVSEQANTVTFTAHSYLALLERRLLPRQVVYTQVEQDTLAADLVARAKAVTASNGTALNPGAYLPLKVVAVDPAGNPRAASGIKRDRTYEASQKLDEALFNLAACEQGFDVGVTCDPAGDDAVRLYYPYRGTLRTSELVLEYGSSVRAFSRSVNSADYGNFWRVVGATPEGATTPLYAERWNSDANDINRAPVGLWMSADSASDVTVQATVNEQAGADLALGGVLIPSYTLDLARGWYTYGRPRLGDVCSLRLRVGRLDVASDIRVLGFTYDVDDDSDDDDVSLTVGRPDVQFKDLFTRADRDIAALARR